MLVKERKTRNFRNTAAGTLAVLTIASIVPQIASAEPSAETLAKLRAMGLTADMKAPPAWALPANTRRSDAIPSNFPIPVYRSNVYNTQFYNSTRGAASASASISTKDRPDVVYSFYQSQLVSAGWKTQVPTPEALAKMGLKGQFYLINGTRDIQAFNITIRPNPQVEGTVVSINWYVNSNQRTTTK
jgi:hypothetical protein